MVLYNIIQRIPQRFQLYRLICPTPSNINNDTDHALNQLQVWVGEATHEVVQMLRPILQTWIESKANWLTCVHKLQASNPTIWSFVRTQPQTRAKQERAKWEKPSGP